MAENFNIRDGAPSLFERCMEWLPTRLRRGTAVVPVVRLSGVIGAVGEGDF